MGTKDVGGEPTSSCRLDWLAVSYFAATEELQREQLAYWGTAIKHLCPGAPSTEGAGRRFYEKAVVFPEVGVELKWTPPGDSNKNPGFLTVDLRGKFFKYATPEIRSAIYLDIADQEGFRRATRLDSQRTLIEPISDAESIHRQVRDRAVWLRGYESYSQLGPVDSKGDAVKGASVVWGSPQSQIRCITYNKALEDGWSDCRAVRHEVRRRGKYAENGFADLVAILRAQEENPDAQAETRFVQAVLKQHMTYLDTSRLSSLPSKADWPDNWARDSRPASFWDEVVSGDVAELTPTYRVTKALDDSVAAMTHQYGRKVALWVMVQLYRHAEAPTRSMQRLMDQSVVRLRDDDLEELLRMTPESVHASIREDWPKWLSAAAENVEGDPPEA